MNSGAKYKVAVGLDYDAASSSAPGVTVKGTELSADEIVKLAVRYGIPVVERGTLASALALLDLDQEIPPHLYEAVAIILGQIDKIHTPTGGSLLPAKSVTK